MKGKSGGKSHSWWWDSHNAPKNSKWLEENLNEMDAKVKAMLRLIEEDADSFAKRAEMYYKKRPELVSLVEEFYRAYRSLAERYDQLTGHIRQIPQEIQAQLGFSGDASPGSPGSGGSVRRRAAGFDAFSTLMTGKRSHKKDRKDGSDSSSSSTSDLEDDSKQHPKPSRSEEIQRLRGENEQLREDLDKGVAHYQALEMRLAQLQEELKDLQHQNGQLHRSAASAHSEIAALEAEVERLKKENFALGEEASVAIGTAGRLQRELEESQEERSRLTMRLEETGIYIHGVDDKIRELQTKILHLTEDLLSSTSSVERLEKELMILSEERNKFLIEVSVQAGRIRELDEEIARLQASLALAHSQKEEQLELQRSLEKTLADLQIELSSVQEEKAQISGELHLCVEHVQNLENHLKETQAALEYLERGKAGVAGLLSKTEAAMADLQMEFSSMQEKLNDEISIHVQEKQAVEEQVEELKSALAASHHEKSRGLEFRDVLERKSMDLEEELRVVKEELKASENAKKHLGGLLSKTESSLSKLQEEFGVAEEKLKGQILVQAEEKQVFNGRIEQLQAELTVLYGERSEAINVQGLLEERLMDLEQRLKQVQAELEVSESKNAEVSCLLGNAERNLSNLQSEFGVVQEKLNEEISLHAEEKQALRVNIGELQAALEGLHGERSRGVDLQDVLEKRVSDLEQHLQDVQESLGLSERGKAELSGLLCQTEDALLALRNEFGSVQKHLNQEIGLHIEEKEALKLRMEELQAALEALQDEKSRGVELQDVLERRLEELSQQLEQVQGALEIAEKEKVEVGDLLSKAELRFVDLQGHFGVIQERLSGEVTMLTKEKETLKEQLDDLQATLAALHDERSRGFLLQDALEKQLIGLQQELSEAKKENASLLEDLHNRIAHLIAENQDVQREREGAITKCDSLSLELAQEHHSRITAEEASARFEGEIEGVGVEIAKLQAELHKYKEDNRMLTEAAMEQERLDAIEVEALTKAMQGVHEENGSPHILERSLHFEGRHSTLGRFKDSMLHLLTDRSKIKQEAAAHAEYVKVLKEEIEKSELLLEASRGDYHSLAGRHESLLEELQALQLQVPHLEGKLHSLEVEKKQLQEELLSSVKDSDERTAQLLRHQKEVYEKLVTEGERVIELQDVIKLAREEAVVDKRLIDNLNKEIERLLSEIQEIRKAKEEQEGSLTQELQYYLEEKSKLQGEISSKDEQITKLEEEMALLKTALTQKEQDAIQLQEHKQSLEGRLELELRKLDDSASLWHEERSSLVSSASLSEQKALELLEQLGLLTQEKEELSTELQEKALASDFQQQEIKKLKEQLEDSNSKIAHLEEHSLTVSQKYGATLSELEALQMQFSGLQEENGMLGRDVLSRTVSVTELTEVIFTVEKKNADLEAELKRKLESVVLLEAQLSSFQLENDRLKEALNAGSQEMQALVEEISKLRQLHLNLQGEHECLASEKQRSLDEHSLILVRLEKMKEDFAFQQNKNSRLERELQYASSKIQDLEIVISQLEKEKKAFSVEIASTVLLMNDLQERADGLQEEINKLKSELMSSNEQLEQKINEIQELSSLCQALREEKSALSLELEHNVHEFGSLETSLHVLQDEHLSLVDRYAVLSTESASGASLIQKLKEEIAQLSAEKEAQDQLTISRIADIRRLQEELLVVQDAEKERRSLLHLKEQTVNQLEEELERLKAAKHTTHEEHKQERERLETELKRLELVVISLSDEKVSVSEKHALSSGRCQDLEALCRKLRQQLAELHAERSTLMARLSLIDEVRREALDDEEMVRVLQERVACKQQEIEQVHATNEDLKEVVRKFESEVESLKEQIIILQKKNVLLNDDLSTKATLLQELNESFTSLNEQKVAFEGGIALAVGNVGLVQAEVNKLLEKIAKLTELSDATEENLSKTEDKICKLQVSNLSLKDEIAGQAKKEKSYVIAVRFMRAEFVCLVQRIRALKEEKAEQARLAELSLEAEQKKNGDVVSSLHQELAFLREENKRQRVIIFDRAEEKREAIRQLCITLDYMQARNRRLEGVIASTRDKIQRRITATRRN